MSIRSLLLYSYFSITGLFGVLLGIIVSAITLPFDPQGRLVHTLAGPWIYHYLRVVPGWRLEWQGRENIDPAGTYIVVANHQSILDVILLYGIGIPFKWTAKSWVFKVPVAGWFLILNRHMMIRKNCPALVLERCKYWLGKNMSVLIFPEGTRSIDGALLPFKYGAFKLSAGTGEKILPVVIEGTRAILPKGSLTFNWSGKIRVRVLEAVDPHDFDCDEHEIQTHLENLIGGELAAMRQLQASPGEPSLID